MENQHEDAPYEDFESKVFEAFAAHYAQHGTYPTSLEDFCSQNALDLSQFKEQFGNFDNLEDALWVAFFSTTRQALDLQVEYQTYAINDKILAFYFTWVESIRPYRAYIKKAYKLKDEFSWRASKVQKLKAHFDEHFQLLIDEGKQNGQIADRTMVNRVYTGALWLQFLTIFAFWINDKSENQEQTDAFIEKSVRFSMDILAPNLFDSLFDFGAFVFKSVIKK